MLLIINYLKKSNVEFKWHLNLTFKLDIFNYVF